MKHFEELKNKVVFSTNPDFNFDNEKQETETPAASSQTLYVSLQRLKGGKVTTVVENFIGNETDLKSLGKQLKNKCGSGGTVKDGLILIQGEQREKVIALLNAQGYKTKKKGG